MVEINCNNYVSEGGRGRGRDRMWIEIETFSRRTPQYFMIDRSIRMRFVKLSTRSSVSGLITCRTHRLALVDHVTCSLKMFVFLFLFPSKLILFTPTLTGHRLCVHARVAHPTTSTVNLQYIF